MDQGAYVPHDGSAPPTLVALIKKKKKIKPEPDETLIKHWDSPTTSQELQ